MVAKQGNVALQEWASYHLPLLYYVKLGLLRGFDGYQLYDLTNTGSLYLGTVLI